MDDEKSTRLREEPVEKNETDDAAIVDEGWSKVDLHEGEKTPEADLPSDIEQDA